MSKLILISGFVLVSIICGLGCQSTQSSGVQVDISENPFELLSEYHFFVGKMSELKPNEGVLPYDLNSPLFSDYAEKMRFVWMPEGTSAIYQEGAAFEFPVGAVLIKNFFYENDVRRIIETRLLINKESGWDAMTYVWNDEQTEAYLNLTGDIKKVEWAEKEFNYLIPNRNQCKSCHSYDGKLQPIGPKAHQLNKAFPYAEGSSNQLEKWSSMGYLSGFSSTNTTLKAAQWNHPNTGSLHERAMSYLDSNCGHCHNPHGSAYTSGLNLIYNEPIGITLGVMKQPVATGKGSGDRLFSIVPGHPEESILVYRMESKDPGAMMPELGRQMVHEEGVALIKEWIQAMEN